MKASFVIIAVIVIAIIIFFFILGQKSMLGTAAGLVDAQLTECSAKPNCVCSEFSDDSEHYIDPVILTKENIVDIKRVLKNIIQQLGGNIKSETDNYIAATFTSKTFKFVDDLEIRIDTEKNIIHMRSASRVGYSDADVNKNRIELLRKRLSEELNK